MAQQHSQSFIYEFRISSFLFPLPQEHLLLLFHIFVWIWNSDWINPKIFGFQFSFFRFRWFEVRFWRSNFYAWEARRLVLARILLKFGWTFLNIIRTSNIFSRFKVSFWLKQRGLGSLNFDFPMFQWFEV